MQTSRLQRERPLRVFPVRILLADDHQVVRQGLRALFKTVAGVEVVHDVADGTAVMSAARTVAPDVVVMDLSMTPIVGLTAMRQIREAGGHPDV